MWLHMSFIPFIWSPVLFWIVLGLVFLIYNVQLIDDNFNQRSTEISIYRFMIHRTSFAFTILHCILLLINTTSNKVFKSLLLCRNTGNLQWFTRVGSVTLIIITLFFGTPDWFIQTYASIIAPILGIMWLVYQGYIILYLALKLHVFISCKVTEALKSPEETVGITIYGLNYQINPVYISRGITTIYIILFISIVILLGNIATSNIFPSSLSTTIIAVSTVLGILSIAISTNKNTNRGLLIPTLFMVYMISIVLSILFLDPANPHNITIHTSSSGSSGYHNSVFIRYSSLLQGYMIYNDVMNGIIYIICVYFCIMHYHHSTIGEARTVLKRSSHTIVSMTKLLCIQRWRSDVGSGKRASEEEGWLEPTSELLPGVPALSLLRSSSHSSSNSGSSRINNSVELKRDEEVNSLEEGFSKEGEREWSHDGDTTTATTSTAALRSSQEQQVNSSTTTDKASTTAAVTAGGGQDILDPLAYLPMHYIRMILLITYTALILTNWSLLDGTSSRVSIADLHIVDTSTRMTFEHTLTHQYFILSLYIIAWIFIWVMYIISLYSTYNMKCQYIKIRYNSSHKKYSECSDAEVTYEDFVDFDIDKPFPRVYID